MISRRSFTKRLLGTISMLPAGLAYSSESPGAQIQGDLFIGGGRYTDLDTGVENFVLSLAKPGEPQPALIPMDFFPHGITVMPSNPNQMLVMEKKGPGCALVDIDSKEILLDVSASEGCWFYGHGAYSKDSSQIYVVETDLGTNRGLLSIRDAKTSEIIGQMDTYGANPHDCQLIEDGNYLAITNAGLGKRSSDKNARPCVTYVDASNGQLLEKIPLTNTEINAGHLLVTDNTDLAVVSAPREGLASSDLGGISLQPNGEEMKSLSAPEEIISQLDGETLSLAYDPSTDTLAATTPDANLVTFWKMADRSFLSAVKLPKPRGICLNTEGTQFLVSVGDKPMLFGIDAQDLKKLRLINQNAYISGSHLYNWALLIST